MKILQLLTSNLPTFSSTEELIFLFHIHLCVPKWCFYSAIVTSCVNYALQFVVHLNLQPLNDGSDDEDTLPTLKRPHLCCAPKMTVHHLCEVINVPYFSFIKLCCFLSFLFLFSLSSVRAFRARVIPFLVPQSRQETVSPDRPGLHTWQRYTSSSRDQLKLKDM